MTDLDMEHKEILEKLKPLHRKATIINGSIAKHNKRLREIEEAIDLEYSKGIPDDPSKVTDDQWAWILKAGERETQVQYAFHKKFFKSLYRSGFVPETDQIAFCLPFYNLNKEEMLFEVSILVKHLKPFTFSLDETGIRFLAQDLSEGNTSVLYIHSDESVALYTSRNAPRQDFKDFPSFLDWYSLRLSEHEDDEDE